MASHISNLAAPHAEGPWRVGGVFDNDGSPEIVIERVTSGGSLAVAVALPGLAGQEANAHLPACAPELLAQLKRHTQLLASLLPGNHPDLIAARDLIARAQPASIIAPAH